MSFQTPALGFRDGSVTRGEQKGIAAVETNWKHLVGVAIGLWLYQAFLRSFVSSFATQVGFPLSTT